ncbi:Regulatory protein BlaR1 [Stieleria maiorica]|uniref:Regulatory protein BlaR1 n=1 Tax=Stieleria maiorica TaxID=2795974 RepID=A0A5B9MID7_9BACT|nr:M56 family metallopeptidase [Stieleria maiorica]QEG00949.1 Regulatory protein BlaR1 [Stieleria maiorica]
MNAWNFVSAELSWQICVTLLHSLWQIPLIALFIWLACRWGRSTVERKYLLHVAGVFLSIAVVPLTFVLIANGRPADNQITAADVGPAIVRTGTFPSVGSPENKTLPEVAAESSSSDAVAGTGSTETDSDAHANAVVNDLHKGNDHRISNAIGQNLWRGAPSWIVGLYLLGVMTMLIRLGRDMIRAERIRLQSRVVTDGPLLASIRLLAERWSLHVLPRLATTEQFVVPQVLGLLKPTILMPASAMTGLSSQQLEMILAHEFAHLQRQDMWVNLLQRVAESLLFFNPALWMISRRTSLLREYCCDEIACQVADEGDTSSDSGTRWRYAEALLLVAEASCPTESANLATVAADGRAPSDLRRRIASLLGQPLREPLQLPRRGFAIAIASVPLVWASLLWQANAQVTTQESDSDRTAATSENDLTDTDRADADRAVATARARTFGLQNTNRIAFRQSARQINVPGMQPYPKRDMASLWKARGSQLADQQPNQIRTESQIAWDGDRLLLGSLSIIRPDQSWRQTHFWDGRDGWIGEIQSTKPKKTKNVYRYASLEQLTEHVHPFSYPHWAASGDRLPWPGQAVLIAEHSVAPSQTHYRHAGTETIDGELCDVYVGPERSEQVWIAAQTKLVKAVSRHYLSGISEELRWKIASDASGKTIGSQEEYDRYRQGLSTEEQSALGARWAAAAWDQMYPGNLTVFSDYQEIAPGVRWPMTVDRVVVHPSGQGQETFKYYLSKIAVDMIDDFDMDELAADALPDPGVKVTDRTGKAPFEYIWSDQLTQAAIEQKRKEASDKKAAEIEQKRQINATPINTIGDAIEILTDGPKIEPTMVWARAIKFLTEHPDEALPALIKTLDEEQRDHPISKLAFALRAVGDPRAVPALIRAFPRTLLPGRSDFGLLLEEDDELRRFMQQHDLGKGSGGKTFNYGRAFREVVGALHKLTNQNFNEMELNWIRLEGSKVQRRVAQQQFDRVAQKWANWWEADWKDFVDDPAFSKVNLISSTELEVTPTKPHEPLSGPNADLVSGGFGGIIQSVHNSGKQCFFDLDTGRLADWPSELAPLGKTQLGSTELRDWARREGFDVVGITLTPDGETEPLYCLMPLGLQAWKITEDDHRKLTAMAQGKAPYPLSDPVELLVPRRIIPKPRDSQHSGDSFLFVTREGTTGVIRLTAQVTNTEDRSGYASSDDFLFENSGFHRGVKYAYQTISELSDEQP